MPSQPSPQQAASELAAKIRRSLGAPPELWEWPLVSIVVLNRNGVDHLMRLLHGLTECTDYPHLELILIDNGSSDDSLEFIRCVEAPFPISIHANPHNESFSDGCNQGAGLARGELLLFLNNDAQPFEPGWLRELVGCLYRSGVAAVGPTLLEPIDQASGSCGYLVHQRGLRARDEGGMLAPAHRDHHADPLGEGLGEEFETLAVVAACLLVDRAAFERVGGFTHGYWYGPEDIDLGLKLRELGMFVRCSGRSNLIHPSNSTLSTIDSKQRGDWVRGNRRLFGELWGPRVRREFELDRLRGGGLWAEPDPAGASPWGSTPAEVEALGFCLKWAAKQGEEAAAAPLDALAAALRRRGRRVLALRGAEVESLEGLDYDVVLHRKGSCRYIPKLARINLLWEADDFSTPTVIEHAHYDLTLNGDAADSSESAERLARRLIEVSSKYAEATGFRTRVEPR